MNNALITFQHREELSPIDGRHHKKIKDLPAGRQGQKSNIKDSYFAEAITSIDGRYRDKVQELAPFFSEYALNKFRILIELQYLCKLSSAGVIPALSKQNIQSINQLYKDFNLQEFDEYKEIEKKINHDVKAVEYYLRLKFDRLKLSRFNPYIHIGLTSEDVTNLSYALILKDSKERIFLPLLNELLLRLKTLAKQTKKISMLGRTHGQPAVPTTFGKEIANYYYRLQKQLIKIKKFQFEGKCDGAVGSFNSLQFVYPQTDWIKLSKEFVRSLGLVPDLATTQILPYDNWIEYFQTVSLINEILVDGSVNIWQYIMLEILTQKKDKDQIGSSTMPQKINPIDYENAEGNLQLANSYFDFYQRKLSRSRLQRDLSDSTVRRTFGSAFAYTILGWKSFLRGLSKIDLNKHHVKEELFHHWEVLTEAIQTYLRSVGDEKAYEKLKELTQGKIMTQELYGKILQELKLEKLKKFTDLTPETYTGLAEKLTELILNLKLEI